MSLEEKLPMITTEHVFVEKGDMPFVLQEKI